MLDTAEKNGGDVSGDGLDAFKRMLAGVDAQDRWSVLADALALDGFAGVELLPASKQGTVQVVSNHSRPHS